MDRTKLKFIAIGAMVCDHIAWGFVEFWSPLGQLMHIIGRFTIPIMCFFVAEGFRNTSSIKGYIKRMLCFWVITIIPFYLFFGELYEYRQNIIFDLLLGLLLLTVLESKSLKKWQKVLLGAVLFGISAYIGGWVIMPMLYILVFYYVRDFKKQAVWVCGLTVFLEVFLIVAVELNRVLHFSKYDWPWYDKLYFLGFMLPLILIKRYNGEKGKTILGKYFFYVFYPAHFLVLAGIRALVNGCTVYDIYVALHVLAVIVCLGVLLLVLWAKPSRGQSGTLLLASSGCIYTFGFLVEITSGNVGGFYAATLMEYFGECILMIGFTMFVAEMCHREVTAFIYAMEWVCGFVIMWMLLTTRENGIFYTYIGINEDGPFPRLVLEYGWGFYFFVFYVALICTVCVGTCILGITKSGGIDRKRLLCTVFAVSCPWIPNFIRSTGITGGYEIPCLGIMGAMVLVGMALTRYRYFDSIALAGENALSHGQEGIMVIDNRNAITYFNKQMEELFGTLTLKQDVFKNKLLKDIFEGRIKKMEQQGKIYEMRVEPLEEGGYIQGHMLWILDITEHHQMLLNVEYKNEQLQQAKIQAEEARKDAIAADEAKGKFLAHMSHEIRTPINAVLGMDTMILRETQEPQIKEYALDIQNAGKSLLALINDILDFSKIESGKLEIIHVEYDFNSLIHDISNMLKAKAEAKNLKLNIFLNEKLPSRLLGDDVRIRQVLINLLNNAIKYTQKGSVILRIDGRTEGGKVVLDFSVEDTGIGIKEEDIIKLFQAFQRIEEKRNRNIEGTGLGLNITTQLLGLMGSKLQVESEYGKGSRFYFSLEQQIVDDSPVGNLEERIRKQATEYDYTTTFVAPDAHVLVVDDNIVNLKVFVSLLRQTKINVDVADGGYSGLKQIMQNHYDLIFLDHMMPEMDGIEVLHKMKTMETHKNQTTPVVALTANAITGAKEMYLREGFDAFLSKPINPEKLEQTIVQLLSKELVVFGKEGNDFVAGRQDRKNMMTASDGLSGKSLEDITEVRNKEVLSGREKEEELPMIDGIDWSYGSMHLPTRDLLLETVEDFYKAVKVEAGNLDKFYCQVTEKVMSIGKHELGKVTMGEKSFGEGLDLSEEGMEALKQYRIKVHGMKSSANMIGAIVLGGMAKVLENAAKDADIYTIERIHPIFIKEWLAYEKKLSVLMPEKVVETEEELHPQHKTMILEHLVLLRQALEELDIDEMDRIMALLEAVCYPKEIQEKINCLSALVVNMDSSQAFVVMDEIISAIKK